MSGPSGYTLWLLQNNIPLGQVGLSYTVAPKKVIQAQKRIDARRAAAKRPFFFVALKRDLLDLDRRAGAHRAQIGVIEVTCGPKQ